MTAQEFLAWDALEPMRHEFVRGEVLAMAGAEERHVMVAGNVYVALRAHLRGTPCRTFITDMKLRIEAANCFFYPAVMVTCSAVDAADPLIKREPVLVVEVLSPGTAACDRGDKFAAYLPPAAVAARGAPDRPGLAPLRPLPQGRRWPVGAVPVRARARRAAAKRRPGPWRRSAVGRGRAASSLN